MPSHILHNFVLFLKQLGELHSFIELSIELIVRNAFLVEVTHAGFRFEFQTKKLLSEFQISLRVGVTLHTLLTGCISVSAQK